MFHNLNLNVDEIQITKIKQQKYSWRVEYISVLKNGTTQKHIYPDSDFSAGKPTIEFIEALRPFLDIAIDYCFLDRSTWENIGQVTGINFKHESNGIGLCISISGKEDEGLTININTPYLNPDRLIGYQQKIKTLLDQACLYLQGERQEKQLEIKVLEVA